MTADPKHIGAMFDAHTAAEFKTREIEATMATMSGAPHVTHIPAREIKALYPTETAPGDGAPADRGADRQCLCRGPRLLSRGGA